MTEQILKYIAIAAYAIIEHLLGKTKYGSTIGVISHIISNKGL